MEWFKDRNGKLFYVSLVKFFSNWNQIYSRFQTQVLILKLSLWLANFSYQMLTVTQKIIFPGKFLTCKNPRHYLVNITKIFPETDYRNVVPAYPYKSLLVSTQSSNRKLKCTVKYITKLTSISFPEAWFSLRRRYNKNERSWDLDRSTTSERPQRSYIN